MENGCPNCGELHENHKIMGIEVRGAYDGILIWMCEVCEHMWPRFSHEQWRSLHEKAVRIIKEWTKEKQ